LRSCHLKHVGDDDLPNQGQFGDQDDGLGVNHAALASDHQTERVPVSAAASSRSSSSRVLVSNSTSPHPAELALRASRLRCPAGSFGPAMNRAQRKMPERELEFSVDATSHRFDDLVRDAAVAAFVIAVLEERHRRALKATDVIATNLTGTTSGGAIVIPPGWRLSWPRRGCTRR
jgi:hypothetical protein